jgi:hypothetical protein
MTGNRDAWMRRGLRQDPGQPRAARGHRESAVRESAGRGQRRDVSASRAYRNRRDRSARAHPRRVGCAGAGLRPRSRIRQQGWCRFIDIISPHYRFALASRIVPLVCRRRGLELSTNRVLERVARRLIHGAAGIALRVIGSLTSTGRCEPGWSSSVLPSRASRKDFSGANTSRHQAKLRTQRSAEPA